jgi:Protein of unknown function (DUF2949)
MASREFTKLVEFLQSSLAIPDSDLQLALRYSEQSPNLLPIVLWQYGLVTPAQLNQIFDWLEQFPKPSFGVV